MVIGKREQKNPEQKLCAQVSMLCRQKLLGYAESFEELGRSFHDEARIVGDDRQSILEKCLLQQSRQVMGDHLQTVARIMEQVAGEEMCYRPVEEKRRKNLVQALHSEGIAAAELCYIRKKGAAANGISMILPRRDPAVRPRRQQICLPYFWGSICSRRREVPIS